MAALLGHSNNSQVAKWETGRAQPRPTTLVRLATALRVPVDELRDAALDAVPQIRRRTDVDRLASIVAAVLDLESQEPALVAGLDGELIQKRTRLSYLIGGLASLESLEVVERMVVERLLIESQTSAASDRADRVARADASPRPRQRSR